MREQKLVAVMFSFTFLAMLSGYAIAQHMQGGPMMQPPAQQKTPEAESSKTSHQHGAGSKSEWVQVAHR